VWYIWLFWGELFRPCGIFDFFEGNCFDRVVYLTFLRGTVWTVWYIWLFLGELFRQCGLFDFFEGYCFDHVVFLAFLRGTGSTVWYICLFWGELFRPCGIFGFFEGNCFDRVVYLTFFSNSCSTRGNRRVALVTMPVISHEWAKDRKVFTTSGTYPWSFVTQMFRLGLSHFGDRKKKT
jgi:uncharacterized membrane protein